MQEESDTEDMKVVVTPNHNEKKMFIEYQPHNFLDQGRQPGNNESGSMVVKSVVHEEENGKDYSPSASSWEPTDNSSPSEKKTVERQFTTKITNLLPLPRVHEAVNALLLRKQTVKNSSHNSTDKLEYKEVIVRNKPLPHSTRKNSSPPKEVEAETIREIKNSFKHLFTLLNDSKSKPEYKNDGLILKKIEDLNRSDDNVLITNKCTKGQEKGSPSEEDEWIPIGSGKTLIPIDKYRQVNWKSYTIATRTLLMATFSRRVLATHSLTGKRSPAFQNKPAKMCLDPKIVSDILWEITSKFKVKENLVRRIITTKCADECKMYKSRSRKSASRQ